MNPGALVGAIVMLFGAIAGVALAIASAGWLAVTSLTELWAAFIVCFGLGVLLVFWLAPRPGGLVRAAGGFTLLLGLVAGAAGLAIALGLAPAADTMARANFWALFGLCLPTGLVLTYAGKALAGSGAVR